MGGGCRDAASLTWGNGLFEECCLRRSVSASQSLCQASNSEGNACFKKAQTDFPAVFGLQGEGYGGAGSACPSPSHLVRFIFHSETQGPEVLRLLREGLAIRRSQGAVPLSAGMCSRVSLLPPPKECCRAFRSVDASSMGSFSFFSADVVRVQPPKPLLRVAAYECEACHDKAFQPVRSWPDRECWLEGPSCCCSQDSALSLFLKASSCWLLGGCGCRWKTRPSCL